MALDNSDILGTRPSKRRAALADRAPDQAVVGGAFEAASRYDRETANWNPGLRSADADLLPGKEIMDARVRDTMQNDALVGHGASIYSDSIVGASYALNAKPMARMLGFDPNGPWAEEFQEEAEERFMLYGESENCWLDAARINTFTDMVRLAVNTSVSAGEVLATAEWMRDPNRPFNTAIQMIDTDRLSNPADADIFSRRIVGGIEKNKFGQPIRAYIRSQHPGDYRLMRDSGPIRWRPVPFRKPWGRLQVLHIFEQFRPDQSRGVAAMVSALKEMRTTKRFRDVTLQAAVARATYAAVLESPLPGAEAFAHIGVGSGAESAAEGLTDYMATYMDFVGAYQKGGKNLKLDGVKIPALPPGTKLDLKSAGDAGPLGQEFEQSLLRYIAAALGVSYEQLSKDYSETNYSSARAALAETRKRMMSVKKKVADRFATMVYRLWMEEAINKGALTTMPTFARRDGWLYEDPLRLDALSHCSWVGAAQPQIDPLKETQAAVLRLKYNLTTEEDEIALQGGDWRAVKRQRAREQQMDRDLKLNPVDADPMMNSVEGAGGEDSDDSDSKAKKGKDE